MSLSLDRGTVPAGLAVKTYGSLLFGKNNAVYLGDYEISLVDFLSMANYVLTNTDLEPNDPRLQFVKCIQEMKQVEGYNPGETRLLSMANPVPLNEDIEPD